MKTISSTDLNRQPGVWLKLVEQGETIEITKRDKVIAVLGPPADPTLAYMDHIQDVHDSAAAKRIAKAKPDPELDDWDMPIEPKSLVSTEGTPEEHARAKQLAADHSATIEVQKQRTKPYVRPIGLSKSQQAGGKYER